MNPDANADAASRRLEWIIPADPSVPRPRTRSESSALPKRFGASKVHSLLPLPTVRSEPMVGLQLGARLAYAYRPNDKIKALMLAEARVSIRNVHEYGVNVLLWDMLRWNERFRFGINFRYDPVFPYFGEDQERSLDAIFGTRGERAVHSKVTTLDIHFQYQQPITQYGAGTLRMLMGVNYAYDRVRGYPGTYLVEERRDDIGFTHRPLLHTGLGWDSRDNVYSPRDGGLHHIVFAAAPPTPDRSAWGIIGVSFAWYRSLGIDELVFASTLAVDGLYGDVPFVPLGQIFGWPSPDAYGGSTIGRGFLRRRFIGRFKGYWSSELRFEPVEFKLFKKRPRTLAIGVKGFLDIGRALNDSEPIFADLKISAGPGIYVVWDRFAVIRFDVGISEEFAGFYLLTGHAF